MGRIGEQSEQSEHLEPATLAITRRTHPLGVFALFAMA